MNNVWDLVLPRMSVIFVLYVIWLIVLDVKALWYFLTSMPVQSSTVNFDLTEVPTAN